VPESGLREIARARSARGELVLRAGTDAAGNPRFDLLADGLFLMDSSNSASEARLAELALEPRRGEQGLVVLVGGLGFGSTARAVLRYAAVERVEVVELEPALVDWAHGPLAPLCGAVLADPRVTVIVDDVHAHLGGAPRRYDAILLDVDNGPDLLSHPGNAALYTAAGLTRIAATLRPRGVVAIWSAEPSPALAAAMRAVLAEVEEVVVSVAVGGRDLGYVIYRGRCLM
jgi:spermidine synthase